MSKESRITAGHCIPPEEPLSSQGPTGENRLQTASTCDHRITAVDHLGRYDPAERVLAARCILCGEDCQPIHLDELGGRNDHWDIGTVRPKGTRTDDERYVDRAFRRYGKREAKRIRRGGTR